MTFWLIVDSIYDGQIGVGSVVGSGRQDGFVLVTVVPRKRRSSIWGLKGVYVGLPVYDLVLEAQNRDSFGVGLYSSPIVFHQTPQVGQGFWK